MYSIIGKLLYYSYPIKAKNSKSKLQLWTTFTSFRRSLDPKVEIRRSVPKFAMDKMIDVFGSSNERNR